MWQEFKQHRLLYTVTTAMLVVFVNWALITAEPPSSELLYAIPLTTALVLMSAAAGMWLVSKLGLRRQ